jgi:hypothetical protein
VLEQRFSQDNAAGARQGNGSARLVLIATDVAEILEALAAGGIVARLPQLMRS